MPLDHSHQYSKFWQGILLSPSGNSLLSGYASVSYKSDYCESVTRAAMDAVTNRVSVPRRPDTEIRYTL